MLLFLEVNMKNKSRELKANIKALSKLELNINNKYNDKDIFDEIKLYKKSLSFFIKNKLFDRALYESEYLIDLLIYYLED